MVDRLGKLRINRVGKPIDESYNAIRGRLNFVEITLIIITVSMLLGMAVGARLPHLWQRQADQELLNRPDNQALEVYGGRLCWTESDIFANLCENVTALVARHVDESIDNQLENI